MKVTKIKTKEGEVFTIYDVKEINEKKIWYSIRTNDGYVNYIKKENVEKIETFNEE